MSAKTSLIAGFAMLVLLTVALPACSPKETEEARSPEDFSAAPAVNGVQVFIHQPPNGDWSWMGPMPEGQLGLAHALVANMGGDRNGEGSMFTGTMGDNPDPMSPGTWNTFDHKGNGIPDAIEMSVFEYAYTTPGVAGHDVARTAFDHNLSALFAWTSDGDPCGGDERTLFADATARDEFGSTRHAPPVVAFPGCTPHAHPILWTAAHATISEHGVGPYGYISGYWALANGLRENPIDFTTDPRIDRSAVALFGASGDLNGDGMSNAEKFASFTRAWMAGWRPEGMEEIDAAPQFRQGRMRDDMRLNAYIDFVFNVQGPHPADPGPQSAEEEAPAAETEETADGESEEAEEESGLAEEGPEAIDEDSALDADAAEDDAVEDDAA